MYWTLGAGKFKFTRHLDVILPCAKRCELGTVIVAGNVSNFIVEAVRRATFVKAIASKALNLGRIIF